MLCTSAGIIFNEGSAVAAQPVWTVVSSPNAGSKINDLYGVSCTSPTDCVAVGQYSDGGEDLIVQTLVESWDGSAWSVVPSPSEPGSNNSNLYAISCTNANSCMAVGSYVDSSVVSQNFAETWNGTDWSIVPTPDVGTDGNALNSVYCTTSTNCVAVGTTNIFGGDTLIEAWDGSSWSVVPSPSEDSDVLDGVSCVGASYCTAVGEYVNGDETVVGTLIESWDGSEWSIVPSPNPGDNFSQLQGVSCYSATSCLAVGQQKTSTSPIVLAETWNGTEWSVGRSPTAMGASEGLISVSCTTSTACIAVGYETVSSRVQNTLITSWNGAKLKVDTSPDGGSKINVLGSVACPGQDDCVAVGDYQAKHHVGDTLVETSSPPGSTDR